MFHPGEMEGLKWWYDAIEEEHGIGKYKTEKKAEEAIWMCLGPFYNILTLMLKVRLARGIVLRTG